MRPLTTWAAALLAATLVLAGCTSGGGDAAPSSTATASPSTTPTPSRPGPFRRPAKPVTPAGPAEIPSQAWHITAEARVPFGIRPRGRQSPAVEGYADHASVAPGTPVRLFVSTSAARWRATAYRMGWYGGDRAASVWHVDWQPGKRQPAVKTVGSTFTPTAPWSPSLTMPTARWRPGSYLIRLEVAGHARYIPLTVRSPSTRGRLVLVAPDTTWQAYNDWGGRNLYWGPSGKGDFDHRARAVSFDRPYAYGNGASEFVGRMLPVVALAEKLKLPLAYVDDIDLERDPHLLDGARGIVSMGHDEYYSPTMRRSLERARDAGTNLGFLGANAVYRRIRLESTSLGSMRLEVNYKSASDDPLTRTHPDQTTANWPSSPKADPPSRLIGESYACFFPGAADLAVRDPASWLLAGTWLRKGDKLPGALGPEFDAVIPGDPAPSPRDVVLRSPMKCGGFTHSDATYYTTRSGAGVFDSGTMGWVKGLSGLDGKRTQRLERQITTNLLQAFAAGPAGRTHPAGR